MSQSYGPKIVTDGLVYCVDAAPQRSYSGGTAWYDLISSSSGTLSNGPVATDNNGGTFIFDGTDDIFNGPTLDLSNTNKISLSFFCRCVSYTESSSQSDLVIEFSTNFNLNPDAFQISVADDSNGAFSGIFPITLNLLDSGQYNVQCYDKNLVNDLKWHHWCCQFDKSQGTQKTFLYIDGVYQNFVINAFPDGGNGNFGTHPLFIGARSGSNFPSNIEIANLAIYNRILSQDEILQNYNSTKGRFGL